MRVQPIARRWNVADLTITRDGVAQLDQSGRAGGDRVGRAGKALDQVLQQNAAMVEQTTAATLP